MAAEDLPAREVARRSRPVLPRTVEASDRRRSAADCSLKLSHLRASSRMAVPDFSIDVLVLPTER